MLVIASERRIRHDNFHLESLANSDRYIIVYISTNNTPGTSYQMYRHRHTTPWSKDGVYIYVYIYTVYGMVIHPMPWESKHDGIV